MLTDKRLAKIEETNNGADAVHALHWRYPSEDVDVQGDIEELIEEVRRQKTLLDEFVWGEEHPKEVDTMHEQIRNLKAELEDFKQYSANMSDQCVAMQAELKSARAELAEARVIITEECEYHDEDCRCGTCEYWRKHEQEGE
jgi:peptidoglycan hydrolase CwlO-like protein